MSLDGLRQATERTIAGWEAMASVIQAEPGLTPTLGKLGDRLKKLREGRFTVVVVGEFNRGKSTVLNAMLGKRVLPQKAIPCTAVLTFIRYGEPPRIEVAFKDKTAPEVLTPEEFTKKYELKVDDASYSALSSSDAADLENELREQIDDRFGHISHANMIYPIELCRNGIELVDSPGLGEHAARELRVLKFLGDVDAVVMVLDALQLLNQREIQFIQQTLTPLGLRKNVFFLINRWNQVLESVVDPSDPDEVSEAFSEQSKLIDSRLKPFCRFDGQDHSDSRIFRVNALGALQQRIAKNPSAAKLEESNIPAFEASLAKFLTDDRLRARRETDLALIVEIREDVRKFIQVQSRNAQEPIEALRKKDAELQPKLNQLREIGRHISHYLTSKASETAEELGKSFDHYVDSRIVAPLPEAVKEFDLGRADHLFVSFDAALDLFRPENRKFKTKVAQHLQNEIASHIKPKVLEWTDSVKNSILKRMGREVKVELQAEAGHYVEVMGKIDDHINGDDGDGPSIDEQLNRWIADFKGPDGIGANINDLGLDLAPLVGMILVDLAAHMTLNFLPGLGILVSGILMLVRRNRMREKIRGQIVEGIVSKMPEFKLSQREAIREAMNEGFSRLKTAITQKIENDIAVIDASLKAVIAERETHSGNAEQLKARLDALAQNIDEKAAQLRVILNS